MSIQVLCTKVGSGAGPLLLIHGGAGPRSTHSLPQDSDDYSHGLKTALSAGSDVLDGGGRALDAVCAAVTALEDNPLFNSARGASLTGAGTAELDAAIMTGDGRAGAIAACTHLRNPILGARAVMERTPHVLLINPSKAVTAQWRLSSERPEYFLTEHRQQQLAKVIAEAEAATRHGTVGAVALDTHGQIACATSTGGMVGQAIGRIGDTALIGAGSFADSGSVAVSCTGEGEAFIRGAVAHDIAARIRYSGATLADAVHATFQRELESRGATGGTIALTPAGDAIILHNSKAMFAGYWEPGAHQAFV